MKHRFAFFALAILLVFTSILAPMPEWVTKITGSGGQLGIAEASGDILPTTISQAVTPPIVFSETDEYYKVNNWTFTFAYAKNSYTDLIYSPTGDLLADSSSLQLQVDAFKFDIDGSLTWKKISDYEYEITRTFNAATYGATLKLIWNINLERNKLTIDFQNGTKNINQNVAFNWLSNILTHDYVETGDRITFEKGDTWIGLDWSDVTAYVASTSVSETLTGRKAEIKFTVGNIAKNAHIVIDPATVGQSSTVSFFYANQRKVVYAASRFWVISGDGTDLNCHSSLDGVTWAKAATLVDSDALTSHLSLWYDSDNICIAYAPGAADQPLQYCQFTPCDNGTLSQQTAWQTAKAAGGADIYYYSPFVTKDENGKPVIAYIVGDTGSYTPYVTRATQTDGTWSASDFDTQMSASASANWRPLVLPMDAGDLIAIYAQDGATVKSKFYDGSWNSENATTALIEAGDEFSAVVDSDYTVHLVFNDSSEDIQYTTWTETAGAWDTEEEIYTGTSTTKAPVLSKTLDDNLYCFWAGDNVTDHIYYKAQTSGVWDTTRTDWLTESDITDNASISVAYSQTTTDYIPVVWLTSSSPYNVRFAGLEREIETEVQNWLTGYGTRTPIPCVGAGAASTNYVLGPIILYKPGEATTLEYNAAHWSVNSKNYDYRFSFTIEERSGDALVDFVIPFTLDTQSLVEEGYFAAGSDGNEVEFARSDAATTALAYWVGTTEFGRPDTSYKLVCSLSASTTHTFYCYVDPARTATSTMIPATAPTSFSVTATVTASADDVTTYHTPANFYDAAGVMFQAGAYTASVANVGSSARWVLNVPQGAQLLSATLIVNAHAKVGSNTVYTDIWMEAANDAGQVTSHADFDDRGAHPFTTATVGWDLGTWTAGVDYSVDITAPVQEVVDRPGFASGNHVQLFWKDSGSTLALAQGHSYDTGEGAAVYPRLRVQFAVTPLVSVPVLRPNGIDTACENWPWDMAFTDSDQTTELTHYIDAAYLQYAKAWVKVTDDLSAAETPTIYCYHGNASVDETSPNANRLLSTFASVSDDFSGGAIDDRWAVTNTSTVADWSVANSLWYKSRYQSQHYEGTYNRDYFTWIDSAGYVRVTYYDLDTNEWALGVNGVRVAYQKTVATAGDPHCSPTLLIPTSGTYQGRIFIFMSTSAEDDGWIIFRSIMAEDIHSIVEVGVAGAGLHCVYPQPFMLSTGTLALAGGYDYGFGIATSTDGWETNTAAKIINNGVAGHGWIYGNAAQDGAVTHVAFHCNEAGYKHIHYLKNTSDLAVGSWYKADGSTLVGDGTAPFNPAECDEVSTAAGVWVNDLVVDSSHNPYICYLASDDADTNSVYWAHYHDAAWSSHDTTVNSRGMVAANGLAFGTGASLDPSDPTHVFIGVETASFADIQEWHTSDAGANWSKVADVTTSATIAMGQPYCVRNYVDGGIKLVYCAMLHWTDPTVWQGLMAVARCTSGVYDLDVNKYHTLILRGKAASAAVINSDDTIAVGKAIHLQVMHLDTTPNGQHWLDIRDDTADYNQAIRVFGDTTASRLTVTTQTDDDALDTLTLASTLRTNVFQDWWVNWIGDDNADLWVEGKGAIRSKTPDVVIPSDPLKCHSANSYITFSEGATATDYTLIRYILVRGVIDGTEPSWTCGANIGEPLEISVSPDTWTAFYKESSGSSTSSLRMNTWYTSDNDSSIDYFTLTNLGTYDVDVLISSSDNWTGIGKTWTVSPIGEPGNATIGLWAGLEGSGGYYILIKPDALDVFNFLVRNLAASGTQDFGLLVYTCTSNGGNATMTGQVVLTAVVHT